MVSEEGRRLHGLAAQAREDGDHLKALQLDDESMLAYQKDGDILGFAEVVADRSIVLRHLADETGNKNFLIIAKSEMVASVEIARGSGDKTALALPLFNLAKVQEELGELQEAVKTYTEAIQEMENNPPEMHNRPSVLADMKVHLATCEYMAGEKNALERAEQALRDLEKSNEVEYNEQSSHTRGNSYNKDVWVSGGHMRIAVMLKEDNPQKAKEHLQKAKAIIDANPDLTIRKTQWEKLTTSF